MEKEMIDIITLALLSGIFISIIAIGKKLFTQHEIRSNDDFALVSYRSQKSDGPVEGTMFVARDRDETWVSAILRTTKDLQKTYDMKSELVITYFYKL